MTKEEIEIKDSDILARLIYRAYIAPDPHAPLEAEALLPFAAALRFYAKTVKAEETEPPALKYDSQAIAAALGYAHDIGASAASVIIAAADAPCGDSCPVEFPEEPASDPDTADTKPPDTHTHTAGTNDGGGGKPAPFAGYAAGEKREIYAELQAFVATHGLGARRKIAEASSGALMMYDVQEMTDCGKVPIHKWRAAKMAMDKILAEENASVSE